MISSYSCEIIINSNLTTHSQSETESERERETWWDQHFIINVTIAHIHKMHVIIWKILQILIQPSKMWNVFSSKIDKQTADIDKTKTKSKLSASKCVGIINCEHKILQFFIFALPTHQLTWINVEQNHSSNEKQTFVVFFFSRQICVFSLTLDVIVINVCKQILCYFAHKLCMCSFFTISFFIAVVAFALMMYFDSLFTSMCWKFSVCFCFFFK